jgi:Protein of unknown function (DUF3102)
MSEAIVNPWTAKILAAWRSSIEGLLECGRLLAAAKEALPHGEFQNMVERDLPFGPRTAQRLMAIAADPRLAKATHASLLPNSWDTLYELTRLDDATFQQRIADGSIYPEMGRTEAIALRKTDLPNPDQFDLFKPSTFLLTATGRKLEKALERHCYAQAKLTKNSEAIIRLVVETIRNLEKLVVGIGEPGGVEKIQAEFDRLQERVHRLMGPSRVPG